MICAICREEMTLEQIQDRDCQMIEDGEFVHISCVDRARSKHD